MTKRLGATDCCSKRKQTLLHCRYSRTGGFSSAELNFSVLSPELLWGEGRDRAKLKASGWNRRSSKATRSSNFFLSNFKKLFHFRSPPSPFPSCICLTIYSRSLDARRLQKEVNGEEAATFHLTAPTGSQEGTKSEIPHRFFRKDGAAIGMGGKTFQILSIRMAVHSVCYRGRGSRSSLG